MEYLPDNQNPVVVLPASQQDDFFQVLVQPPTSVSSFHPLSATFRAGSAGTNRRLSVSGDGGPATSVAEGGDEETASMAYGSAGAGDGNESEVPTGSIRSDDGFRALASASSRGGVNALQETEDVHDPPDPSSVATAPTTAVAVPGMSKFFHANRHLFGSDLMRQLVSLYTFLYEQSKTSKANGRTDEFSPWDHIYPKGKDGMPMYNTSGKYIVRLYCLGSWRKVTVDDRMPLDSEGQTLIISSPSKHELWPLLLTKALLKVAAVSYKDIEGVCEHGDFDAFHTLEGWLPETIGIQTFPNPKIWSLLSKLNVRCQRSPSAGVSNPSGTLQGGGTPTTTGGGNFRAVANAAALAAVKDKERSASMTITNSNNAPNERASTASSTKTGGNLKQNTSPSILLFVSRDSEDGNERDVSSLSYPCRIIDVKDIGHSASVPVGNTTESGSRKYVKIKGYFSTVSTRKRTALESRLSRTDDGTHATSSDASEANLEYWISFSEFCKMFRSIRIYHSQSNFRPPKFISYFPDATKTGEQMSRQSAPSQVFYVPDSSRETNVMISFSTVGRIMSEAAAQHPVSSVKLERYDWKRLYPRRPLLRIASNATAAAFCSFPAEESRDPIGDGSVAKGKPPHACRVNIDAHNAYVVGFWSKDEYVLEEESKYLHERLGCHVRELEESYSAQPAGSWSLLFKQVFLFPDPIYFATQLFLPEAIQHYACLRMYNNDTGEEIPQTFHQLGPRLYSPNEKGYTLVAECKTPQPRPAGKWRARMVSDPYPAVPPEKPLELNMKGSVQDLEDVYVPNKQNLLFRYVAKVKDAAENNVALHLVFSFPTIRLRLQVFDNDVEIVNVAGKGIVTLPVLIMYREDSPPVGNAIGTKDAVHAVPISKPRNRYIIQAVVEQVEFSRSAPSAGLLVGTSAIQPAGEPPAAATIARPTSSRTKNLSGSAKKKKPGLTGGPEGAVTGTNNEPLWKLRVLSSDGAGLTLTRDTEKEDRHKALKETWEAAQPGRAAKAKESRETYLKHIEQVGVPHSPVTSNVGGLSVSGASMPTTPLGENNSNRGSSGTPLRFSEPSSGGGVGSAGGDGNVKKLDGNIGFPRKKSHFPTSLSPMGLPSDVSKNGPHSSQHPAPHVLTPEEIERRKSSRQEKMNAHASAHERKCQRRSVERDQRNFLRAHQIEAIDVHRKLLEACHKQDTARRDEYRKRLLKELEELNWKAKAAAEEASRLALGLSPGIEVTTSGATLLPPGGNNPTGVSEEVPEKKKKAAKR